MPEANISPRTVDETTKSERESGPVNDAEGSGAAPSSAASTPGEQPESQAGAETTQTSQAPQREERQREVPRQDASPDEPGEPHETGEPENAAGEGADPSPEAEARTGLTPRQARRVRIILSGVVMAAVAVALVVRLGSAPSVLTVGFYGIALILSGTAIVLSRRGRTRVATGVLGLGFGAVALAEWLLASAE